MVHQDMYSWYQDESVRLQKRDRVKVQEQVPFSGDDNLYKTAPTLGLTQVCVV